MTSDGSSTYLYDVENRLVRVTGGGRTTNLYYDPLGRLYRMVDTQSGETGFLHDGNALVIEYNAASGTILRRHVYGSNLDADDPLLTYEGSVQTSTARRYLHADPRGSIVAVADWRGVLSETNSYDAYGIPDTATGDDIATKGRFRYTGQVWLPEIGLGFGQRPQRCRRLRY
ncbi:MAG: hypothetical protein ABJP48_09640 [Erythrobacter sp.]